jgi:hypothetical protein
VSNSYPFLSLSRDLAVRYGDLLMYVDWITNARHHPMELYVGAYMRLMAAVDHRTLYRAVIEVALSGATEAVGALEPIAGMGGSGQVFRPL